MTTLIAAIRSLLTYVAVSLYVLLMGPPFLVIALATGRALPLYRVALGGVRLGLLLSGIKVEVRHGENIRRDGAAVYAVNHASNVEPPILYATLTISFQAAHPLQGRVAEAADPGARVRPCRIRPARAWQSRSEPAGDRAGRRRPARRKLLPDFSGGTRSRTGDCCLQEGRLIMALKGQAPIVPVAIQGPGTR